jgi:hypothetical protein
MLPDIRARRPNSPFTHIDVRVELPGWDQYSPAEALLAAVPRPSAQNSPAMSLIPEEPPSTSEVLRLSAVVRPPLTGPQEADGGVVLKLLTDALSSSSTPFSLQWATSETSLLESLTSGKTDAGLFWQSAHCQEPQGQSADEAALCDQTELSAPLMQIILGVFTRLDASLSANSAARDQDRTLCVPANQPVSQRDLSAIAWIKGKTLKMIRPKELVDCVAAVERRAADGFIATEPEGRYVIEKLKLSGTLQLSQHLEAAAGLHVAVAKDNPKHAQFLLRINKAIADFKASDRYSLVLASHLADLTGFSPVTEKRP